jgi:hypothetical protein
VDGLSVRTPGAIVRVQNESPDRLYRVAGVEDVGFEIKHIVIVPCDERGLMRPFAREQSRRVLPASLDLVEPRGVGNGLGQDH